MEVHTQGTGGRTMGLRVGTKGKEKEQNNVFLFFSPPRITKLFCDVLLLGQCFHWDNYGFRTSFCPPLNADQLCFSSIFYSGYILQPLTV